MTDETHSCKLCGWSDDQQKAELDVETLNAVLRVLEDELHKYKPDSPESIALWKFKERLTQ